MPAKCEWSLAEHRFVFWNDPMTRRAMNLLIEQNQHSIVEYGHPSRTHQFVAFKFGCRKGHIVALPFSGGPGHINVWRGLSVNGPAGAVGIKLLVVRIEDLDFVEAHQQDPIVPAVVPRAVEVGGAHPF